MEPQGRTQGRGTGDGGHGKRSKQGPAQLLTSEETQTAPVQTHKAPRARLTPALIRHPSGGTLVSQRSSSSSSSSSSSPSQSFSHATTCPPPQTGCACWSAGGLRTHRAPPLQGHVLPQQQLQLVQEAHPVPSVLRWSRWRGHPVRSCPAADCCVLGGVLPGLLLLLAPQSSSFLLLLTSSLTAFSLREPSRKQAGRQVPWE